ncbi:CoA ester lyase [Aeromicrobium phragmitis]|uniref:CoA ester lyase n=1 Tax=Aeromicrobium phragmitis TaxID=2478914 RepID=A0A3L8PJ72_9ACTN|nr:aldolase/citrate lyase family protein [Aeromicrobium phragmitis]RLV54743.1 CoA ester lyase [Aeromicrobium phragmitis]
MTALSSFSQLDVPTALARSWRLIAADTLTPATPQVADVLVADLEDGVPAERKADARTTLTEWLDGGREAWVRINTAASPEWDNDVAALRDRRGVQGVMLAMAETAEQVEQTIEAFGGMPVVALIESALGVENAGEIARAGVVRIAFGTGDFRRDLGIAGDRTSLLYARSRLVVASRAARLPGPIDGPTVIDDPTVVADDTQHALSLGLTGRLCTSDQAASVVNTTCAPTPADVAAARAFVASPPEGYAGAIAPRLAQAKDTIRRAEAYGIE